MKKDFKTKEADCCFNKRGCFKGMKFHKECEKCEIGLETTWKWNDLGELIKSKRMTLEEVIKEQNERQEEVIRNFWKNYKKFGKDYKKYIII